MKSTHSSKDNIFKIYIRLFLKNSYFQKYKIEKFLALKIIYLTDGYISKK